MVQDVTERHRARQQLEALNEGLERANLELEARVESRTADLRLAHQEMESFGYSVSHDLRAPLRSMHGFSQALSDDYGSLLDDRGKDYLERIRHASVQMGTLIDGLLKMAQLSTAPLRVRSVNLSTIAQSAIEELALTNPTRSVQCQIQPEMIVEGDPALLRAMIGNLMSNAWKYSSKSSAAVIEFGTMSDGSRTIYFVRDNGVGFDMRYANKLFGPFQRLHSNKEFEGTGIGLANVRRIVERHGGSIWADSKVSQGATFYFNFPVTLKSSDEDS